MCELPCSVLALPNTPSTLDVTDALLCANGAGRSSLARHNDSQGLSVASFFFLLILTESRSYVHVQTVMVTV